MRTLSRSFLARILAIFFIMLSLQQFTAIPDFSDFGSSTLFLRSSMARIVENWANFGTSSKCVTMGVHHVFFAFLTNRLTFCPALQSEASRHVSVASERARAFRVLLAPAGANRIRASGYRLFIPTSVGIGSQKDLGHSCQYRQGCSCWLESYGKNDRDASFRLHCCHPLPWRQPGRRVCEGARCRRGQLRHHPGCAGSQGAPGRRAFHDQHEIRSPVPRKIADPVVVVGVSW